MFRPNTRFYSTKALPFLKQAPNKYSHARSTYNLKPNMPNGLVHNPPAALHNAKNTPKAFLPDSDPRKTQIYHREYSKEEIEDMPIVYSSSGIKSYELTPKLAEEIQQLRDSDPDRWTVNKLAESFNVSPDFVKVTTSISAERKLKLKKQLEEVKKSWHRGTKEAREDRKKRVELWLRNEY